MALTVSSLLNSPKFLCKYLKIYPPSSVVCYAHSQFAVQSRNVERPVIFLIDKDKETQAKRASGRNIKDVQQQLQLPHPRIQDISLQKMQTYRSVNAVWQSKQMLEMHKELANKSLIQQWDHDVLMDQKQLVLMVFEQNKISGKPSFLQREKLPTSKLEENALLNAAEVKFKQTYPSLDHESKKAAPQVPRMCQPEEKFCLNDSISEAMMLFADTNAKPDKKNVLKVGPDPTQLSSVLLELRNEIPEFFLKQPNYSIYHQKIKFVNNITGTTTNGIFQYRAQISGIRLIILSCMTELSVDVLKISKHPNEGSIKVRWRIKGIPLIRKIVPYIGRRNRGGEDCYRYLDGFSVFEVGSDGLIHCHRLHKVMPSSSHEKESPLWMVFLLPFIHLLDPRSCESFSAFECRSTDKDIASLIQV